MSAAATPTGAAPVVAAAAKPHAQPFVRRSRPAPSPRPHPAAIAMIHAVATIVALSLALVASARADEPPTAPTAPAPAPYPIARAARPLLMPRGALELTLPFRFLTVEATGGDVVQGRSTIRAHPHVRYGLHCYQLELGASLPLTRKFGDDAFSVDAAVRRRLTARAAVGLELAGGMASDDGANLLAMARVAHHAPLLRWLAVIGSAGLGVEYQGLAPDKSTKALVPLVAETALRVMLQPFPALTLELDGGLLHRRPLSGANADPHTIYRLDAIAALAATPTLDVYVEFPGLTRDQRAVVLGFAVRRLPSRR